MKKIIFVLAVAGAVTVSCNKKDDIMKVPQGAASMNIGVQVSDAADPETKSGAASEQLFDSSVIDIIDGQEIRMDAYVSDFNPLAGQDGPLTKGNLITYDYLKDSLKAFYLEAYAHDEWFDNALPEGEDDSKTKPHKAGPYFSPNPTTKAKNVEYKDNKWSIFGEPKWINSVDMSFWSWNSFDASPVIDAVAPGETPDYSKAGFTYTNDGQTDLIFAYNAEKREFDEKGNITGGSGSSSSSKIMNVNFHHALAAVRFDVSGLKLNHLQIDSISISGIYSEGHCSIADSAGKKLIFAWDSLGTNVISQKYDSTDFTLPGLDTAQTAKSLMPLTSDKFLFFIPQEIQGKSVKIKIVYSDKKGKKKRSEVALNHATKWEAGKYYTYKLSAGTVSLAIEKDPSTGDVTVKNDGKVDAYIRVAIVANWCMKDATTNTWYPLAECPTGDLEFTDFNGTNDSHGGHWEQDDDGYYYYSKAVEPDWVVELFKSCSAVDTATHPANTELRITVIGQAVKKEEGQNGWDDAAIVSE